MFLYTPKDLVYGMFFTCIRASLIRMVFYIFVKPFSQKRYNYIVLYTSNLLNKYENFDNDYVLSDSDKEFRY